MIFLKLPYTVETTTACHLVINDYIACYSNQIEKLVKINNSAPLFSLSIVICGPGAMLNDHDKFPVEAFHDFFNFCSNCVYDNKEIFSNIISVYEQRLEPLSLLFVEMLLTSIAQLAKNCNKNF